MPPIDTIRYQTVTFRAKLRDILLSVAPDDRARIPAGWNNHALWHAGHLLITPRLLTLGLAGRPLGAPANWRTIFAKDSTPASWPDNLSIPAFEDLVGALVPTLEEIFDTLGGELETPFATPYTTSTGIVLHNPLESLQFSLCHDGIHLGLLLALRRALK